MTTRNNPGSINQLRANSVLPRNRTGRARRTSVTISMSRDIGASRYEFIERSPRDASQARRAAGNQIARSQLDLEAAAAAAHVDIRQLAHRRIDVGLQPAPLPKRADASDDI